MSPVKLWALKPLDFEAGTVDIMRSVARGGRTTVRSVRVIQTGVLPKCREAKLELGFRLRLVVAER